MKLPHITSMKDGPDFLFFKRPTNENWMSDRIGFIKPLVFGPVIRVRGTCSPLRCGGGGILRCC